VSSRSNARKRALNLLYEADIKGLSVLDIWEERKQEDDLPPNEYSYQLIAGIAENQVDIDKAISDVSADWRLDRMSAVDRAILRIGAYEILYVQSVDTPVAISESLLLAQELSGEESPTFINGVLGGLASRPNPATNSPI
jgi:N utilization substance protein B